MHGGPVSEVVRVEDDGGVVVGESSDVEGGIVVGTVVHDDEWSSWVMSTEGLDTLSGEFLGLVVDHDDSDVIHLTPFLALFLARLAA